MEGELTPKKEGKLLSELLDQETFELADKYCDGALRSLDLPNLRTATLSKDEALEAFRRYDKDGDGFLSAEEFKGSLEICGLKITNEEILTGMMKYADLDGDGKLSFEEFAQQMMKTYEHLKANPEFQCYPIFKYFENWCQDENRHGDFFSALMKAQPRFLNDWQAKLWSRFFCLSVYVTMYLNDCQRTSFYEGIGLNTKEFDMHVIIETNRTTARIFPTVLDVENPEFKRKLDRMVVSYEKILAIGQTDDPSFIKTLKRIPLVASLASEMRS